jgi:Zn-dependent M28 family amino/carboxypeptidase
MCGSATDAKCDAPGANDDASGTAAVLEMARVMAKYKFDATSFSWPCRRRAGSAGATYFAEQAKKTNMDIEGMFTNDIVGNSLGGNGVRDARTVRVFSEGIPSNETEREAATPAQRWRENDSQSRQLARFVKESENAMYRR